MAPRLKGDVDTLPPKNKNSRGAASTPKTIQQRHISYEPSGERIKSFLAVTSQPSEVRTLSTIVPSEVSKTAQTDDFEQNDERDCQFEAAGLCQLIVPDANTTTSVTHPSKRKRTQAVNIQ